jgi:hypothetical protein
MRKKLIVCLTIALLAAGMMSVAALASTTSDVETVLTTSFTRVVGDITSVIGAVLPIALGVLAMTIAITFGIRWFRRIVGSGS